MKQSGDYCTTFCRCALTETMNEVRKFVGVDERKKAWAWKDGRRHVEFHGPEGFYWYGTGCCLWNARTEGWRHYLEKNPHSVFYINYDDEESA